MDHMILMNTKVSYIFTILIPKYLTSIRVIAVSSLYSHLDISASLIGKMMLNSYILFIKVTKAF